MVTARTVGGPMTDAGTLRLTAELSLFAVLTLLASGVGEAFRYPEIGTAILFPPYAVLAAFLILSRPPREPACYILIAAVAHFATHWPRSSASWVLAADLAYVAQSLTAASLVRWRLGQRPRLDSIGALLQFLAIGGLVAPAVGAIIGASNVVAHSRDASLFASAWAEWFMSNAITGLTILPALTLCLQGDCRHAVTRRRIVEATLLGIALLATYGIAAVLKDTGDWRPALGLYAPIPVLIWASLRFGVGGTSIVLTAVTVGAMVAADRGIGPFSFTYVDESILIVQLFALLTCIPILCLASLSSGRRAVLALHRALLASVHDHVAMLDRHGVIVETNDSWRREAELPVAEPLHRARVGDSYRDICRSVAERGCATATRLAGGLAGALARENFKFETEYDFGEHGARYVVTVESLALPGGGAIVRRSDVTTRYHSQMEAEDQRRQLSHLARVASLGQLSGALAHELNQPLASIGSNAEAAIILLNRAHVDAVEISAILRDIVSENRRAAEVIRRLRAMLKRGETRLVPLDVGELVSEVMELAHAELITRRVKPVAIVPPGTSSVVGDRVQLQQVLLNLILNACEAMARVSESERKLVVLATEPDEDTVQLSIRDSGPGISAALMDRLFEPFVTTKSEGLGLGLSISRTIVALHGGRLWAENNTEGGTTVHCVLRSTRDVSHEPRYPRRRIRPAQAAIPAQSAELRSVTSLGAAAR
jgi:two-component system, LuxR family, sensor kinase FixL